MTFVEVVEHPNLSNESQQRHKIVCETIQKIQTDGTRNSEQIQKTDRDENKRECIIEYCDHRPIHTHTLDTGWTYVLLCTCRESLVFSRKVCVLKTDIFISETLFNVSHKLELTWSLVFYKIKLQSFLKCIFIDIILHSNSVITRKGEKNSDFSCKF